MTDTAYKAQAKRLADYLSRVHGVKLKHASLLEAIAQAHGRADWNTLLACGSVDTPSELPAAPAAPASRTSLLNSLIEQALALRAESLTMTFEGSQLCVYTRMAGVRRDVYTGTQSEYDDLLGELRAQQTSVSATDSASRFTVGRLKHISPVMGRVFIDVAMAPVAATPDAYVALRWRHPQQQPRDLNGLGMACIDDWSRALAMPSGVLLVCGPTMAGVSTTVTASARELARQGRTVHVLDPDVQSADIPGAINVLGRVEPGCVLVIDVRCAQTAQLAFDAAARGALVLASVHASAFHGAMMRLSNLNVPEEQQALVRGILVQRLVAQACAYCKGTGCDKCTQGVGGQALVATCITAPEGSTIAQRLCAPVPSLPEQAAGMCRSGIITPYHLTRVFGFEALALLGE